MKTYTYGELGISRQQIEKICAENLKKKEQQGGFFYRIFKKSEDVALEQKTVNTVMRMARENPEIFVPMARNVYFNENRANGDDRDSPYRSFPEDGQVTFRIDHTNGNELVIIRYTEGVRDRQWMEERDRNYLMRLKNEGRLQSAEPRLAQQAPALYAAVMRSGSNNGATGRSQPTSAGHAQHASVTRGQQTLLPSMPSWGVAGGCCLVASVGLFAYKTYLEPESALATVTNKLGEVAGVVGIGMAVGAYLKK